MKVSQNIINISALTSLGAAVLWLFTNMAWASDIDRMEARMIRQELRELRKELREATDPSYQQSLREDIQEAIDDLCEVKPDDRECK